MGSVRRRLERLEASLAARDGRGARGSGRPPRYAPEGWAERERRFERLFAELDGLQGDGRGPEPERPGGDPFDRLFETIERYREGVICRGRRAG